MPLEYDIVEGHVVGSYLVLGMFSDTLFTTMFRGSLQSCVDYCRDNLKLSRDTINGMLD